MKRATVALLAVLAGGVGALPATASAADELRVVGRDLANPRGLAFGEGSWASKILYVAEAGRGGAGPCIANPEGGDACFGRTGAITTIRPSNDGNSSSQRRLLDNLPSIANQTGENPGAGAIGVHDVSFKGQWLYYVTGLAADPARRADLGQQGRGLGRLFVVKESGQIGWISDLAGYEGRYDPDGVGPDTNPYSVDATGTGVVVSDAGANALLNVGSAGGPNRGRISTRTVLPATTGDDGRPIQAVPTGLVRGLDGTPLVGQLTGYPFKPGSANVFAAGPAGQPASVFASGFTTVIDVAVGKDGSVYVLELTRDGLAAPPSAGRLTRIAPDGSRREIAPGQLQFPTGVAVDAAGKVYVARNGNSPTDGEVVQITVKD